MKIPSALTALLLAACATGRPGAAPALGPIVTDRPDFTESVQVIAPGHAQLEGGYTASGAGSAHEHSLGELLLRVGLLRRTELRLTNGYVVATAAGDATHGLQDASIGAKVVLLGEERGFLPATSVIASSTVPSGHRDVGDAHAVPEVKLLLARELPRDFAFGMNVNASWPGDARGRFVSHAWSATLGRPVTRRTAAYAEVFGIADGRYASESRWANAGLTYLVHDALQLDVRAGARLEGAPGRGFFVGVGAARRW
jgi:hypothetical protein